MQRRLRFIFFLLAVTLGSLQSTAFAQTGASQETEKKPLVLVVYADWCPYCQNLKPTLVLINERYRGKIQYVVIDVTSEATTAKSREQARSLGLEKFFDKNYTTTSLVVIRDPAGRELFRAVHDFEFRHYETVLDQQLHLKHAQ